MHINLTDGRSRVKLTKSEVSTLRKAKNILDGLSKFAPEEVSGSYIDDVLSDIDGDGVYGSVEESDE